MPEPGPGAMTARRAASVVVCTHDRPQHLPECLASIAAALGPDDELIVVESGDSDVVRAIRGLDVPVNHLRRTDRRKTVKLNVAIAEARNEVLVLTDDDCRVEPGWVDAMVGSLDKAGHVGAAFGPVLGLDRAGGPTPAPLPAGPAPIENWCYAHGASMAVERAALMGIGGFDERLGPGAPTHGEEGDLVVRLASAGWATTIADAPVTRHLEWRDPEALAENLLVYSRGAGAWIGAGLRRDPRRTSKLFILRLAHQAGLWSHRAERGPWFGLRTTAAFFGGLRTGLRYPPRRFLPHGAPPQFPMPRPGNRT